MEGSTSTTSKYRDIREEMQFELAFLCATALIANATSFEIDPYYSWHEVVTIERKKERKKKKRKISGYVCIRLF